MARLVVLGTGAVVLAVLNPWLILSANTPTGGDMGAHVLAPAFLRDVLLPQGRVMGWSNSWFAGFPIFYFYFPLPSLVIVALDLVLPYGVAFKIVTVAGLVALPAATYFLSRCLRFGPTVAAVTAGGAGAFVLMESFNIYGGNMASTLAGEFSFSWSLAFSLLYLGFLTRGIRDDRRYRRWAAVMLALTALSHLLTTFVVVLASIPALLWKPGGRRTMLVWLWGFAIAGFWVVPLVARFGLASDLAWTPLRTWEELLPIEIWLLLPPAAVGMVWAVRRTPRAAPMVTATLIPLIYYPLPNVLPGLFPNLFVEDRWKLWNGRLLPYWYFGVTFFAALTLAWGALSIARRLPERVSRWWPRAVGLLAGVVAVWLMSRGQLPEWAPWVTGAAAAAAVALSLLWGGPVLARSVLTVSSGAVLVLGSLAGVTFVDGWARWNYTGYEGKDAWPEYQALVQTVEALPPGRVQWEYSKEMDKYGTPMSLMLLPYWTDGTHPSMEGLFFESSLTTPFHFLNQSETSQAPSRAVPDLDYHNLDLERGLSHMQLYDVRYYITYTEEAHQQAEARPELEEVATSPPFTIYQLPEGSLVDVATNLPTVYEAPSEGLAARVVGFFGRLLSREADPKPTFDEVALDWYDDVSLIDRWVVAEGPDHWPRLDDLSTLDAIPTTAAGVVSDVHIDDHRISFRTTAIGTPHLVKVSYFPNWEAVGAEGPYRAAPSLMVVVPTQNEVVLEFRNTSVEVAGLALTGLGLVALMTGIMAGRRERRPHAKTRIKA